MKTKSAYKEVTVRGEKLLALELAGDAEFIGKENHCFFLTHVVSSRQEVGTLHLHVAKSVSAHHSCHPEDWSTEQYFHYDDIPLKNGQFIEFAILDVNGDQTRDIAFRFESGALVVFHARKP